MKKILTIFSIICIFSTLGLALEIKIYPSSKIHPTQEEISVLQNMLKQRGVTIKDKETIKKRIQENRILANTYLQKYGIPKKLKLSHKLDMEEEIADLFIHKNIQLKLNDQILRSYYTMHQKRFYTPKRLSLILYEFKNFHQALQAYKAKNFKTLKSHEIILEINQLSLYIRPFFENLQEGEITPPLYFKGRFIVFKVKKIIPKKLKPFEDVKQEIKQILIDKAYATYRKQLLQKVVDAK